MVKKIMGIICFSAFHMLNPTNKYQVFEKDLYKNPFTDKCNIAILYRI